MRDDSTELHARAGQHTGPVAAAIRLLPIPGIGSIARGDQRLNCSMRGSMRVPHPPYNIVPSSRLHAALSCVRMCAYHPLTWATTSCACAHLRLGFFKSKGYNVAGTPPLAPRGTRKLRHSPRHLAQCGSATNLCRSVVTKTCFVTKLLSRGGAAAAALTGPRARRGGRPGQGLPPRIAAARRRQQELERGPSKQTLFASRSVRRALLTPQVSPGSRYRCAKRS